MSHKISLSVEKNDFLLITRKGLQQKCKQCEKTYLLALCEVPTMNLLLKKALFRIFGLLLWTFVSAWLFVLVEDTEKDDAKEKYRLLLSVYVSMAAKYNMSIEEFNRFSSLVHEALSAPKPRWTFPEAVDFVFQAETTIGKEKYKTCYFLSKTEVKLSANVRLLSRLRYKFDNLVLRKIIHLLVHCGRKISEIRYVISTT